MAHLPQEIVEHICSYLDRNDLHDTLTVSRQWQVATERCSGAFRKFTLTEKNAQKFLHIYSGPRFHYLRRLIFNPDLPALVLSPKDDDEYDSRSCRESSKDLADADNHFTNQIYFLFATMKKLEDSIDCVDQYANIRLTIYTPTRLVLEETLHCRHRAFVSWRLQLLRPRKLPSLGSIVSLVFKNGRYYDFAPIIGQYRYSLRKMDLRAIIDISNKLNNLRSLKCRIGGEDWVSHIQFASKSARHYFHEYDGPQRDTRHNFAKAIRSMALPDNLREVDLDFVSPFGPSDLIDQRHRMPNLSYPNLYDTFSSSLRLLSYPLRRLKLRAVLDKTVFWPDDEDAMTPAWPNLEVVSISFHLMTPSGDWYFRGLENEASAVRSDEDQAQYPPFENTEEDDEIDQNRGYADLDDSARATFRVFPNDTVIVPFLAAFAHAAARMLALREAALWAPLCYNASDMGGAYESLDLNTISDSPDGNLAWGIIYARPGTKRHSFAPPGEEYSSSRQMWWRVGRWCPDEELHEMFRKIGREQYGDALLEYWHDQDHGCGLVSRSEFDEFQNWHF